MSIKDLAFDGTISKYEEEMRKAIKQDLSQKVLRINVDKFRNYMNTYETNKKTTINKIREPALISLTLITVLFTSTFNDVFGLKKEFWEGVFWIATIVVVLWTLFYLIKYLMSLKKEDDIDKLIDKIFNQNEEK